jgi:hypothetical protein
MTNVSVKYIATYFGVKTLGVASNEILKAGRPHVCSSPQFPVPVDFHI